MCHVYLCGEIAGQVNILFFFAANLHIHTQIFYTSLKSLEFSKKFALYICKFLKLWMIHVYAHTYMYTHTHIHAHAHHISQLSFEFASLEVV